MAIGQQKQAKSCIGKRKYIFVQFITPFLTTLQDKPQVEEFSDFNKRPCLFVFKRKLIPHPPPKRNCAELHQVLRTCAEGLRGPYVTYNNHRRK
nr:MAG TPA: hypothetical protein [Caudoviricetes sp.]